MRHHHPEIRQRDHDGLFDVISGDTIAGPFPSRTFAMQIAYGEKPAPIDNAGGRFRRFRIERGALLDA